MNAESAERQLILISAGTAERRAATAARAGRLASQVNWLRLVETLRWRKLLPTLGPRVIELSDGQASADFATAVGEAVEAGRRQGAFLQLISMRVGSMLADAGIRSSPLKGPTLGEALHGDPGRRLSSDVDLLVDPAKLNDAVDVVRSLGYSAPSDYVYDDGLPLLHYQLVHENDELPPVELHWRIHWYERTFAAEHLLPPEIDPIGAWKPAPGAELVALLLFYARDGFVDVRLATDIGAWWDRFGGDLQAGEVNRLLRERPAIARAVSAAARVAEDVVGFPAAVALPGLAPAGMRERAAVRVANPNPVASQSQLYADMGFIDGLLAPRGGAGEFVRRQLLPPAGVLERQAEHGSRSTPRSRSARLMGVLARYCVTGARLVIPVRRRS